MAKAEEPVEVMSVMASMDIPDGGWRYSVGPFGFRAIPSGRNWA